MRSRQLAAARPLFGACFVLWDLDVVSSVLLAFFLTTGLRKALLDYLLARRAPTAG